MTQQMTDIHPAESPFNTMNAFDLETWIIQWRKDGCPTKKNPVIHKTFRYLEPEEAYEQYRVRKHKERMERMEIELTKREVKDAN